jgi:hypothetical protein
MEDIYLHMCVWFIDYWEKILKSRWILHEFQYVIEPRTICYLKKHRIGLDFALRHLHNIAIEFCAYITVLHNDLSTSSLPVRRTFSVGRSEPRYEMKCTEAFDWIDCDVSRAIRSFAKGGPLSSPW